MFFSQGVIRIIRLSTLPRCHTFHPIICPSSKVSYLQSDSLFFSQGVIPIIRLSALPRCHTYHPTISFTAKVLYLSFDYLLYLQCVIFPLPDYLLFPQSVIHSIRSSPLRRGIIYLQPFVYFPTYHSLPTILLVTVLPKISLQIAWQN
jgi:hypothetical protein